MVIHSIVTFLETQTYDHSKFETATPTIVYLKIKIHRMKLFVELLLKSILFSYIILHSCINHGVSINA